MKGESRKFATLLARFAFVTLVASSQDVSVAAPDPHIDAASRQHSHNLTFSRHTATTYTGTRGAQSARTGTDLLRQCDSRVTTDQDVACQVTVQMTGTLGTFGAAADGRDIIDTEAEFNAVLSSSTASVKVVTSINWCGTPGSYRGCAPTPGSSLVMGNGFAATLEAEVLVHEFGHNKGLGHRTGSGIVGNAIMTPGATGRNEVNTSECPSYHSGGTDIGPVRPVDVAFIIDDTGSMSEEIGGVRSALQAHLATYPSTSCNAIQLTTFKDNVTRRDPTTDLSAMTTQVGALVASGGADCPEASVEAINQVRESIKDSGRAFVATDADPHAGLDIAGAIAALRARSIRVDCIVTGTCSGTEPAAAGATLSPNDPDAGDVGGVLAAEATAVGAQEAFSQIAIETGGIFAYVPEVNFGGAEGRQRFQNAVFNIVQGSLTHSLALAQPSSLPRGSSVEVTFTGSGTNFTSGTTVEVQGDGVSVSDIVVVSPIVLRARLSVSPGATLGFRDVVAQTTLGGGIEQARGVGMVNLTAAPTGPVVVAITPPTAEKGTTLDVAIEGFNTHFGAASVVSLGSGVTVLSVTPSSDTRLIAQIQVSASAASGARDVSVRTGTEVAGESVTGPFFLIPAAPPLPQLTSVDPAEITPGGQARLNILGLNVNFVEGVSFVEFSGSGLSVLETQVHSPTEIEALVEADPTAAPGYRDIRVVTGLQVATKLGGLFVSERLTADAGNDTTIECRDADRLGTRVQLDGTRSEGVGITFEWAAPGITFDDATSSTPTGHFPEGTSAVTLTVRSGTASSTDVVLVTIEDTQPPTITVTLNRTALWPANHKLMDVTATVSVSDVCDPDPVCQLRSIVSSEPDNGLGDGDTPGDIQGADTTTCDKSFQLRAERSGSKGGRTYTVTYSVSDNAGHMALASAEVVVPHDQAGSALAATGWNPDGHGFQSGAELFGVVIPSLLLDSAPIGGGLTDDAEGRVQRAGDQALALDVGDIEVRSVLIGNSRGVIAPVESRRVDANGDGFMDLLCLYRVSEAQELQSLSQSDDGPLGVHYSTPSGDYLFPDIGRLGTPLTSVALEGTGALDTHSSPTTEGASGLSPVRPARTAITGVSPNPARNERIIGFDLARDSRVDLTIYDLRGARVRGLVSNALTAGGHRVSWDGRTDSGKKVAVGTYFAVLVVGNASSSYKIVVVP